MSGHNGHPNGVFAVPIEICASATHASQFSLLVRPANPLKQNLRAMARFFPRLWGMDTTVVGRVIDHGRVQFLFPSNEALQLVFSQRTMEFQRLDGGYGTMES
ncbi:hypothetical protein V5N11_028027 [Cardamine amara subsp. amara]|uniref:DUF4283 domain-containing protein n=1 Tax=Cardamine amara subsp. amara TaxID=228776 RepID=A0ABD1AKM1_CARAN